MRGTEGRFLVLPKWFFWSQEIRKRPVCPDYPRPQIIPLWDFFQATSPRLFTPINPISPQHTASFFESYYETAQPDGLPTPYGPEYGDED